MISAFSGKIQKLMKTSTAVLFSLGIIFLSSCKKLDEEIQGYFFVQNTDGEEYSLKINGKDVGVLPENNVIPLVCVDSTLVQTTMYTIDTKKNEYELKNSKNEVVAKGLFKIRNNGMTGRASKDFGAMYMNSTQNTLIVGFNTEEIDQDYVNQCAIE